MKKLFLSLLVLLLSSSLVKPSLKIDVPIETLYSYTVKGKEYSVLNPPNNYIQTGTASCYGPGFHGKKTATGEKYNMHGLTAASKSLPLNAIVKVTNRHNNKTVIVRINDRGPFVDNRILDLSKGAAKELDILKYGVAEVEIKYIKKTKI